MAETSNAVTDFFSEMTALLEAPPNYLSVQAAQALVAQISAIANLSPTLTNQLSEFQTHIETSGGALQIGGTSGEFNENVKNPIIQLPGPGVSGAYPSTSSSLPTFVYNAATKSVSPDEIAGLSQAGEVVGVLAHELGHYEDANLITSASLNPKVGLNQGFYIGIGLLSEGKATANAIKVAREVAAAGNSLSDDVYIPLGGGGPNALNELTSYPDPSSAAAVGSYASFFATLQPSASPGSTYFQYYKNTWTQTGGTADAALTGSTVTSEVVTEDPDDGSLSQLILYRTVNATGETIASTYDFHAQTRSDKDAKTNQLLDSEHADAGGTSDLTNFANAGPGSYALPLNTSVTNLTNGSTTDTTASITGSNGFVTSLPISIVNYGKISGTSAYGAWLLANSNVTNGSTTDTTASITSADSAALVLQGSQGPSAVTNYGSIGGTSGIVDTSASALTVNNLGTVNGGIGASTGSVNNQGTISGFNGVGLGAGGTVTNGSATNTTASITGGNLSIAIGTGSLANYAKVTGNVQMAGTITNGSAADTTASIAGLIYATGITTLSNFGAITGGVSMVSAGGNTVTNGSAADTTASIVGGVVTAGGSPSTINNFGSITASNGGNAVTTSGSANVTNGSATDTKALLLGGNSGWGAYVSAGSVINFGTIKGGEGCIYLGSGTVTNAGTIESTTPTGTAIQFGSGANKLIEKVGATVSGTIFGGGSLELANDGTPVTMASNISVGTLVVDPGTTWSVTANASVPNIVEDGTVSIASGGRLDVSSAVDPSSSGIFQLMTKGSLELGAILGSALKIQFLGSSPTNELTIDNASKFGTNVGGASYAGPLLENFVAGDVIDIRGIGSTGLGLNYSAASGDLQITGASGAALATLAFQNSTLGSGSFHAVADGFGGALITHS